MAQATDCSPHCLHCVVAPIVSKFAAEHRKTKRSMDCVRELATVVGDLVASSVIYGAPPGEFSEREAIEAISNFLALASGQIMQSATLFWHDHIAEFRERNRKASPNS